ncbi:epidermal differentiation-specific protein-like [Amphiura filiformis]|uniref:epidermal differentiation-specific protein-like n=1 Tax=Amphiura filiformis TaxID=82378 RepID=UPI003B21A973
MATAKIVVYQDSDFKGASREITEDISDLNSVGFNDRISSIKVFGSVWVGYADTKYGGRQYILEEGDYKNSSSWNGSNDQLSSLKRLNTDNLGETGSIELYEHDNYGGKCETYEYEINNLKYYNFNDDVSSIKVKKGTWIIFDDADFKGRQYIVTEGSYPDAKSWKGSNDTISSLRPVKEPAFVTEILSMEFDIAAGLLNTTPKALVNLNQTNNTSAVQEASWSTTQSVSTTRTYEWHWENTTAIGVDTTYKTGVPIIAQGEITMSVENTFSVGEGRSEENTQTDEWTVELPAKVQPQTRLNVQAIIQEGKIDVPFKAMLKRGEKIWEELGTYNGVQSFNLHVEYNETPL